MSHTTQQPVESASNPPRIGGGVAWHYRGRSTRPDAELERILRQVQDLAPQIGSRSPEMETARRLPPDIVELLKSAGMFRLLAPRRHGGLELEIPAYLEVIRALARIEGSVGWNTAINANGHLIAPLFPRDVYDGLFRNGPGVVFAGSGMPAGTAEARGDGYHIRGRWPFVSGCQYADYIFAMCVMTEGGKPVPGATAGTPSIRMIFAPARQLHIENTWHTTGLRGTGSHHVAISDVVVPATHLVDMASPVSCLDGPLYQGVFYQLGSLSLGAVAIGVAEGALGDLIDIAISGRQQHGAAGKMRDSEVFQSELARIQADIRAAQSLLELQSRSHWDRAQSGTLGDQAFILQSVQSVVWVVNTCVRAADTCFALAGASAIYDTSPLQRRMRDLHTAAQHQMGQLRQYAGVGKLLLDDAAKQTAP